MRAVRSDVPDPAGSRNAAADPVDLAFETFEGSSESGTVLVRGGMLLCRDLSDGIVQRHPPAMMLCRIAGHLRQENAQDRRLTQTVLELNDLLVSHHSPPTPVENTRSARAIHDK